MGEEFAASTPFLYFADHEDPEMAKLVAEGRKKEFAAFGWDESQIPNPEDKSTFLNSRLNWPEVEEGHHAEMLEWTRNLIHLRRSSISLNDGDRGHMKVTCNEDARWLRMDRFLVSIFVNLGTAPARFETGPDHRIAVASDPAATIEERCVTVPKDSIVIVSAESE